MSGLWNHIEGIVREEGFELFDLESSPHFLRVYIYKPKGEQGGIRVEDCARISKRITALEHIDEFLPGEATIEVSSPGINRKLTRPEHFHGAIGERVKVKALGTEKKGNVIKGVLLTFDGSKAEVEDEDLHKTVSVAFTDIQQANVDFLFERV